MRTFHWRLEQLEQKNPDLYNLPTEFRITIIYRGGAKEMFIRPLTSEGRAEAERLAANDSHDTFRSDSIPADVWYGAATQDRVRPDWNPLGMEIIDGITGSFPGISPRI